jgi:hypothetical protein
VSLAGVEEEEMTMVAGPLIVVGSPVGGLNTNAAFAPI